MGFNTTVLILNDAVHNMDEDPDFAKKLKQAIHQCAAHNPDRPIDVSIFGHVNAASVVACAHADVQQVIAVGGNHGHVIGYGHWSNSEHRLLRKLAAQHGFRLVRDDRVREHSSQPCRDCSVDAPFGTCLDCKSPLDEKFRCPTKDATHRK